MSVRILLQHGQSWSALTGIEEEFKDIVKESLYVDDARCDAICNGIRKRVERLFEIAEKRELEEPFAVDVDIEHMKKQTTVDVEKKSKKKQTALEPEYEVTEDVAYSGK